MTKGPTPRQLAREQNIARIKNLALDQLAESGAAALSLRAIARELNLVSSAIYRYYASRDELITALIIDAYDDLAAHLEEAARQDRRAPRRRWADTCHALRAWATTQPHRFGLIYGSTIPGYAAPQDTVAPAARVVMAFCAPVSAAGVERPAARVPRSLGAQLDVVASALGLEISRPTALTLVGAFAGLIGALTLELNGQFVGGFEPADELYAALVDREADALGL